MDGFISIDYDDTGYIKDDDAKDWDADELLDNLREGTIEGNEDRIKKDIAPIEVLGWMKNPIMILQRITCFGPLRYRTLAAKHQQVNKASTTIPTCSVATAILN